MNIRRLLSRALARRVAGTLLAAVLVVLAGDLVTRVACARVVRNTIDDVAVVSPDGRHLDVTGPLEVTSGERVELEVTITQRSTGAVAKGSLVFTATGEEQHWAVRATTVGRAVFEPGSAWAVGLAVTTEQGGNATDAHQWLVNITLVQE
jgi:hypothetical protein